MGLSSAKSKTKPNKYAEPYITSAAQAQGPAFQEASAVGKSFQPGLAEAGQFYQDTLGGKFLDGNPHLQGMIDQSNGDITDRVNGTFMSRFGSGYHAKVLARALADNERGYRFNDYNTERGYQNQAGQNLAGIAGAATALPQVAAGTYAGNVGGLMGRYTDTKQTQPWGQALMGGFGNAAGAYFGGR